MSFKKNIFAVAVALPLMACNGGVTGPGMGTSMETTPIHYAGIIKDLIGLRGLLEADLKHAKSEADVLEAAKNIGHVEDAITTLHAVMEMHGEKSDKKAISAAKTSPAHYAGIIRDLGGLRGLLATDLKHAESEAEVLEAAKNIGHIEDAMTTLHAVMEMHKEVR